jgi:enoyl-CoA hydratase/carnithine racemase
MADRVAVTVDGGVADVRLDRPEKLNALDAAMVEGIVAAGEQIGEDPTVRAVVLSGAGRGFCAGLDFAAFGSMIDDGDDAVAGLGVIAKLAQRVVRVWAELPVPVIAAIHGPALGGGLQLALGADMRIVAPDARLGALEIRWGIVPDMTGTQVLPRLVGIDHAKDLVLTGRTITGEEAVAIGLATRVSDDPRADAMALAREIASMNPHAVRRAKALLDLAGTVSLADGLAAEREAMRDLVGSPNQVEAVSASFEKRAPRFRD